MHKQALTLVAITALAGCFELEDPLLEGPYDDTVAPEEVSATPTPIEELGEQTGVADDSRIPVPLRMSSSPATGEPMFYVDSFVAADGTGRYIERHGDDSIGLIMDQNYDRECQGPGTIAGPQAGFWKESWIQSDPLSEDPDYENYCGPVAARNLLNWYGECVDFQQLGAEMRTNDSLSGPEWWMACATFCAPDFIGCTNACYGILQGIEAALGHPGSWGVYVGNTLAAHTPAGYHFYKKSGSAALSRILAPLSDGNPVVALINSQRYMNHYVVVTGTYWSGPTLMLRLANRDDMSWNDFRDDWSLAGFGDDIENSFRDEILGDKPYTYMYYSRDGSSWDQTLTTTNDCLDEAAARWPEQTAKFTFSIGNTCYYRDFDGCPANAVADRGHHHELHTCYCDSSDTASGTVRGTDIYSDDSKLCRAAVHAGVIPSIGGLLTYEVLSGQPDYDGSQRYGVTSSSFGSAPGSFALVRPNLALGKAATASSSSVGGVAERAVDGTTDGLYVHQSVTHTTEQAKPWWKVDLGAELPVGDIELYNRTDCCSDRLADFDVILLDDIGDEIGRIHHPGAAGAKVTLTANRVARYIKVQLTGTGILSLAEVKVFAMDNLALTRPAEQSSVKYNAVANRAVDGITSGLWSDGSVTHTYSEAQPWWEVDLGVNQEIGDLVIHNRTDCCSSRLTDFAVVLFNNSGNEVKRFEHPGTAGQTTLFEINHSARYVRVERNGTGVLSLAEVEVYPMGIGEEPTASEVVSVTYIDRHDLGDSHSGTGDPPPDDSDIEIIEIDGYFSVAFTTSPDGDMYRVRYSTSASDPTPHTTDWWSGFFTSQAVDLTPCLNNYIRVEARNEFGTTIGPMHIHYANDGTCGGGGLSGRPRWP